MPPVPPVPPVPPISSEAPPPLDTSTADATLRQLLATRPDLSDPTNERHPAQIYRPILASRDAFDPETHDAIARIYQGLLGCDAVYRQEDRWNIASPSGVRDLQAKVGIANLTFVVFRTHHGLAIYFAQDIDAHTAAAPILAIQRRMGGLDAIVDGPITIIDARRREQRALRAPAASSAFARASDSCPNAPARITPADAAIAEAMRFDAREIPVRSRLHVSRLVELESASVAMFWPLRALARRSIHYVFLRDTAVRQVNSNVPTVREYQRLAVLANRLRDLRIVGNAVVIMQEALALLDKAIVTSIAKGLQFADSDSKAMAALSMQCAIRYLELLARFIDDNVLSPESVWTMLKTTEGAHLLAMLGFRARITPDLDAAIFGLLDAFVEARVLRTSIASLLVRPKRLEHKSFLKELSAHWQTLTPRVKQFVQALEIRRFAARTTLGRSPACIEQIYSRGFRRLNSGSRLQGVRRETQCPAVHKTLDRLCRALSPAAIAQISRAILEQNIRVNSPTITIDEQHAFRAAVKDTVDNGWRKELPDECAPRRYVEAVIKDVGPEYGLALANARKAATDRIRETALDAYETFLTQHPDASARRVLDIYTGHLETTRAQYRALIEGVGAPPCPSPETALALCGQAACVNAATLKARRATTPSAAAGSAGAALDAEKRAIAEQARQDRLMRQAEQTARANARAVAQSRLEWLAEVADQAAAATKVTKSMRASTPVVHQSPRQGAQQVEAGAASAVNAEASPTSVYRDEPPQRAPSRQSVAAYAGGEAEVRDFMRSWLTVPKIPHSNPGGGYASPASSGSPIPEHRDSPVKAHKASRS